jgi:hypothetical protein
VLAISRSYLKSRRRRPHLRSSLLSTFTPKLDRPGVQQLWNLTLISLTGRPQPGSLTASIDAAARRGERCRQSIPGCMGIVRPAADQKGRGEESPELGGFFSSPFLLVGSKTLEKFLVSPVVWENSRRFLPQSILFCSRQEKPNYYQLRSDPRFKDLVRRVGVP